MCGFLLVSLCFGAGLGLKVKIYTRESIDPVSERRLNLTVWARETASF